MKICAIICEYNPLHDGHVYHIKKAKELSGCDKLICIMSGSFTQRGIPAVTGKYFRAKLAVMAGADMVVELPVPFAAGSAEDFACGAVGIALDLKAEFLSFGAETDDLSLLKKCAEISVTEPQELTDKLALLLKEGNSYTKAYRQALQETVSLGDIGNALLSNSILAIEYLKAIRNFAPSIVPIAVKRIGQQYLENELVSEFSSATAIRKAMAEGRFSEITKAQNNSFQEMQIQEYLTGAPSYGRLHTLIRYKCQTMPIGALRGICGVNEGLENLIKENCVKFDSCNGLVDALVSKRYTRSKICRILLAILLGITTDDMAHYRKTGAYINVLAVKKESADMLKDLPDNAVTDFAKLSSLDKKYEKIIQADIEAKLIYELICGRPSQPFIERLQKI